MLEEKLMSARTKQEIPIRSAQCLRREISLSFEQEII